MERQSPVDRQPETNRTVAGNAPSTSAAVAMATASSGSTACTLAPSTSLSIAPPDRQAVQVIQHAIHRPQSMAAQYLHQMYAAQQQHLMLQTAALQQHQHAPHLQSLATIQQASVCQRQPPSSSSIGSSGHQQTSVALPGSPVTAQLIGRTQGSNSAAGAATTTISQQAMLLGSRPASCNQAQMYLRTQMLILTPAATVAAVQPDLPAVTSCSSLPTSSQVQNLALRAHLPGALAAAHSVILKPPAQSQAPAPAPSKTSICAPKADPPPEPPAEAGAADATRMASGTQIVAPGAFSPAQAHALVRQQLSCPLAQRLAHHQLVLQRGAPAAPGHRQLQPITLRVAPQDGGSGALPLSLKRPAPPGDPHALPSAPSSSSSSSPTAPAASSAHTSVPAAAVQPQPQPPPLLAAPQRRTTFPQNQPPPPPPPLVLPRMPQNPPASLQRLSLHSVQALAVQSGQVLLTEQELPVAEALVQMPYQNLPPPQTVAVDLKVHPVKPSETTSSAQTCRVNGLSSGGRKEERSPSPRRGRTSTPLAASPKQSGAAAAAAAGSPPVLSGHSVIRSPQVEAPSQLSTTSSGGGSSNPPPPPPPLPPAIMPAAVRGPSQPPSAPASLPGSPDRVLQTQILTHLIEGFVIQEGLEPFPVGPSSLLSDQQASLPESHEMQANGEAAAAADDSPLDADQSDSTDSEMENDGPAADALAESAAGLLQCEFCGGKGHAHTFLRSKRFCSMTCVRRFSVSCTKRVTTLRAGHWGHRPAGRRGRPPGRVNGAFREQLLKQTRRLLGSEEAQRRSLREEEDEDEEGEEEDEEGEEEEEQEDEEEEEDAPPVPMTTRLRTQAERERKREREHEQGIAETISISDAEEGASCPSQWSVEQVFSYISSLPGGHDVAEEFRSQEIDGQALLLLSEEHLVGAMNLKLGPALKLCAFINSLKDA